MQDGARSELIDYHTFHHQRLVIVVTQIIHLRNHAIQRLTRKAVTVKRNQQPVCRDQGAEGVEVERGRRIDVDAIVVFAELNQQLAQFVDLEFALKLWL
ncbi:hypothetical protein D3C77_609260 [compost metagenome]